MREHYPTASDTSVFDGLLVSCPNEGGGLFAIVAGAAVRIDLEKSTDVRAYGNDILRAYQSGKIADGRCCTVSEASDIHDVLYHENAFYVVSTGTNEIIEYTRDWKLQARHCFKGEGDSWHLNCLVAHAGQIFFSAFGEFTWHREYKGKTRRSGFVRDLLTGEELIGGLSQPHSLVSAQGKIYLADSECGDLVIIDDSRCANRIHIGDYFRGIFIRGDFIYVGLSASRNIESDTMAVTAKLRCYTVADLRLVGELDLDATEIYSICDYSKWNQIEHIIHYAGMSVESLSLDRKYLENELQARENDIAGYAKNEALIGQQQVELGTLKSELESMRASKDEQRRLLTTELQHQKSLARQQQVELGALRSELESIHISKDEQGRLLAAELQHEKYEKNLVLNQYENISRESALMRLLLDELKAQINEMQANQAHYQKFITSFRQEKNELEIRCAEISEQLTCVIRERDAERRDRIAAEADKDAMAVELRNTANRLDEALRDCSLNFIAARTLEDRESILLAQYNKIVASNSWRITRPFRFARRVGSELVRGRLAAAWAEVFRRSSASVPRESMRRRVTRRIFRYADSKQNIIALNDLIKTRCAARACATAPSGSLDVFEFDISIVTYNSEKWIEQYFDSLVACGCDLKNIHVYVVDHGSSDGTMSVLLEQQALRLDMFGSFEIATEANLGFGAGHDFNIKRSKSDFVLISNIDLQFTKDCISVLLSHVCSDTDNKIAAWETSQAPYEHPKHYDPVSGITNWQAYACVLIRRQAYVAVGGFDKRIFMYCEDVELSYRLRSFGWLLMYCPDAVVIHHSYESGDELFKPLQFYNGTLGAGYVRLRYGTTRDRLIGFVLQAWLIFREEQPLKDSRAVMVRNLFKLVGGTVHFMRGKGGFAAAFPFRGFDFELTRPGANVPVLLAMDDQPLLSIITRTYSATNRHLLLTQAGISIGKQRYRNIEWIVVQDGGDDMQVYVEEVQRAFPHLQTRFIATEKLGRSFAGNTGLAGASGEYCMFLDDDDLIYADHCELLMRRLIDNQELAAAYALAFEVPTVYQNGELVEGEYVTHSTHSQEWDFDVLLNYNFIPIQAIIFRRHLYEARGGFDINLDQLEDWNLWLRYGYQNKFVFVPKVTSLYRVPSDAEVKAARHALLHQAYDAAKSAALGAIKAGFQS